MLIVLSLFLANLSFRDSFVFDRVDSQRVLFHILGLDLLDAQEVSQVDDVGLQIRVIHSADRYVG